MTVSNSNRSLSVEREAAVGLAHVAEGGFALARRQGELGAVVAGVLGERDRPLAGSLAEPMSQP
ncbi:hypothetical protein M8I34_08665 [Streptomyces sp. MCA2]|uniref:hypothetical protein n=1 Tax=Streptomyces sp. MCA2 TaxID=2944805 RepID=UPI00202110DE|nr:hypothetical protein [Streptomyces sp. MCA2]MCL7491520.1 hypothetical protein [Streptomyces sp. MCA2]